MALISITLLISLYYKLLILEILLFSIQVTQIRTENIIDPNNAAHQPASNLLY